MVDKPECSPKSYNCGKICLSAKKTCRIQVQGQQEQELKILGSALKKLKQTALDSYQEEFSQIFAKLPPTTPIREETRDFSITRRGGGILLGETLLDDVHGDGVISLFVSGVREIAPTVFDEWIEQLKKEDKLRDGDLLVVTGGGSRQFPRLSKIRITKSGYEIEQPTDRDKAENNLRRLLMRDASASEEGFSTLFTPKQEVVNNVARYRKQEEERFAELEKLDPRTPTSKKIDSNTYRKKAEEFAKELGLPSSANSFSEIQTRMHDIAHPVMYDMLGLSSKDIQKFFGTTGLVAEEALVNALEQMSRGAYPRAAATNGIMLARVLSRGTETASAYRNSEFSAKVEFLVNKMFQNPDLYRYLKVVRKANRISRTVTTAADM